jgi:RNA ligase (TIGR02306 family)
LNSGAFPFGLDKLREYVVLFLGLDFYVEEKAMTNSTHRVEVVPIELLPHPNADSLSIVKVFDGYTVCARTDDWKDRKIGAYIPPDSIVPATEMFSFLGEHRRIRVKRLRGIISMGLLVPAPEGSQIGDDVAEQLGVTHYEPVMTVSSGGEAAPPPKGYHPTYDVDSLRRYASLFEENEPVFISEKIHGANGRFYFDGENFHAGSRTEWKRYDESILWWKALTTTVEGKAIKEFLVAYPEITVYGEVYGQVQNLKYGAGPGEVRIAVFDLLRGSDWVNAEEARELGSELPWVPTVVDGIPFDLLAVLALAEGPSLVPGASHLREGIVVKPLRERTALGIGRVCLKVIGNGYLERA